jgi:hypothetical protein
MIHGPAVPAAIFCLSPSLALRRIRKHEHRWKIKLKVTVHTNTGRGEKNETKIVCNYHYLYCSHRNSCQNWFRYRRFLWYGKIQMGEVVHSKGVTAFSLASANKRKHAIN